MIEPAVGCLDQVWSSIEDLCSGFATEDWKRATDCPGWTVQDQLSHLCGIESLLLGRPQPARLEQPWPNHVRNDLAALNEAQIEERRSLPPEEVLVEFMELTAERLKILTELTEGELAGPSKGPMGDTTVRDLLGIRVIDCFMHEQDMRRATDRPGGFDGDAPLFVFERLRPALGLIVAKKTGAPDGTTVVFEIEGAPTSVVTVSGGRGSLGSDLPASPTVTLRMGLETFIVLAGRGKTVEPVKIDGDQALGKAIIEQMNVLF